MAILKVFRLAEWENGLGAGKGASVRIVDGQGGCGEPNLKDWPDQGLKKGGQFSISVASHRARVGLWPGGYGGNDGIGPLETLEGGRIIGNGSARSFW